MKLSQFRPTSTGYRLVKDNVEILLRMCRQAGPNDADRQGQTVAQLEDLSHGSWILPNPFRSDDVREHFGGRFAGHRTIFGCPH